MFRETLSNRAICVGVILFVLVVGIQLYRWHIRCEIAVASAQKAQQYSNLQPSNTPHKKIVFP
jgi:hypothetical protein